MPSNGIEHDLTVASQKFKSDPAVPPPGFDQS